MAAGFSFDLWVMAISLFSWWSVWSINNPFFFGLSSEDSHAGHVNKFLQAADLELLSQQEEQGKPGEKSAVAFVFSGGFQGEIPWSKDVNFQVVSRRFPYKRCVFFGGFRGGQISPPVLGFHFTCWRSNLRQQAQKHKDEKDMPGQQPRILTGFSPPEI